MGKVKQLKKNKQKIDGANDVSSDMANNLAETIQPQKSVRFQKFLTRQTLIIVAVVFLIVGVNLFIFARNNVDSSKKPATKQGLVDFAPGEDKERPDTAIEIADGKVLDGKYDEAQAGLAAARKKASTKQEESALAVRQAAIAFDAQRHKDALKFAQEGEALYPTISTSRMIARSAEELKNKSLAIEYYKKAIQRLPNGPLKDEETDDLNAAIKHVEETL